ncbi:MAG TPA: hypothetical protein VIG62_01565 [Blastocatellia bacterium]
MKLKEGCKFFPYDNGNESREFIVLTPDNRQFKISPLAKQILERLDGRTSLDRVVCELQAGGMPISLGQLREFLEKQYGGLGIFDNLAASDNQARPALPAKPRVPFFLHWDLIPKRYVAAIASPLRFLYSRPAVISGVALIFVAHYLVYIEHPAQKLAARPGSLWVLLLCFASILFHEFGHATAVSKFGGSPGRIGFGLYVLLPSFYADVSEVWRFKRRQRMVVDLGGIYFQLLSFVLFALLAATTDAPEYFAVCYFIDFMVLLNLNPAFHFDGYWLLVDYLAIPNLYRVSLSYMKDKIKRVFNRSHEVAPLPAMRKHMYWLFIFYALLSNAFLFVIIWISYRYVGSMATQIHLVYPAIYQSMVEAIRAHEVLRIMHLIVTIFFALAFPLTALLGIYRYLSGWLRYGLEKLHSYRAVNHA